jgi:hypothetical protein
MLYFILPFIIILFLYLNKYSSWIFKEIDPDKGFIPCGKCATTLLSLILFTFLLMMDSFTLSLLNILSVVGAVFLNPILFVGVTKFLNKD